MDVLCRNIKTNQDAIGEGGADLWA